MSSPRQPAYHQNANYIDSPFDEPDPYEKQVPYYASSSPYNPGYQSPTPRHATYDAHSLDAEKHNDAYQQSYAMHDIGRQNGNNNGNYYSSRESYQQAQATPQLYNGYDEDRPSISNDTAPMRPRDPENGSRPSDDIMPIKYRKEKSKYLPCFPCIRSTCGRVTCCICLLLLLIIIALAIVIVTVFKLPKVEFEGMSQQPQFTFNQNGNVFSTNMTAIINVENPNPIGFNFEKIAAKAYYPSNNMALGGGEIKDVKFPSKATTKINFPLSAQYSAAQDPGYTVAADIANRCSLFDNGPKQKLAINYDLTLTLNIIGIRISPTIKGQQFTFDCPPNMNEILDTIPPEIRNSFGLLGA